MKYFQRWIFHRRAVRDLNLLLRRVLVICMQRVNVFRFSTIHFIPSKVHHYFFYLATLLIQRIKLCK